jgi:hypothetical protein
MARPHDVARVLLQAPYPSAESAPLLRLGCEWAPECWPLAAVYRGRPRGQWATVTTTVTSHRANTTSSTRYPNSGIPAGTGTRISQVSCQVRSQFLGPPVPTEPSNQASPSSDSALTESRVRCISIL